MCFSNINSPKFSVFSFLEQQLLVLFKLCDRCPHYTQIPAELKHLTRNLLYSAEMVTQQLKQQS